MIEHTRTKGSGQGRNLLVGIIVSVAVIAIMFVVLSGAPGSWLALGMICIAAFAGGWCATALRQTKNRHEIQGLHNHMTRFLRTQDGVTDPIANRGQRGVKSLYEAFDEVTKIVVADNAREQQSSDDRTILVREVHHRVKNNLQLVSSIMSMHMRSTENVEVVDTLARIQDRVASLATVHSDLYQGSEGGVIPMAPLLNEIVDNAENVADTTDRALRIKRQIADVGLLPDQAVPLSLLTAETLHTVLRDISLDDDRLEHISVSLELKGLCILRIEISGQVHHEPIVAQSVGGQLLRAHATQLGAESDEHWKDGVHGFVFSFTPVGLKSIS